MCFGDNMVYSSSWHCGLIVEKVYDRHLYNYTELTHINGTLICLDMAIIKYQFCAILKTYCEKIPILTLARWQL